MPEIKLKREFTKECEETLDMICFENIYVSANNLVTQQDHENFHSCDYYRPEWTFLIERRNRI